MKVVYQGYKRASDQSDKILEIEGINVFTAESAINQITKMLECAKVVWPELKQYQITQKGKKHNE